MSWLSFFVLLFLGVAINGAYTNIKDASENMRRYIKSPHLVDERDLFPWLKGSVADLKRRFVHERGIVISTGSNYFALAVHLIRAIRNVHMCQLPIEVHYIGQHDLTQQEIQFLHSLENVRTVDLTEVFDNTYLQLHGWQSKAFAMLASSFKQTILFDADAMTFQPIETYFNDPGFVRTGALFFRDRLFIGHGFLYTLNRLIFGSKIDWFKKILPNVSEQLLATPIGKGQSDNLQEAGVVVIDKTKVLSGLLMTCMLNSPGLVEEMYRNIYGDKETFWLGFEMVGAPYHFVNTPIGMIGTGKNYNQRDGKLHGVVCGGLAHFDYRDALWWINGGFLRKKSDPNSDLKIFTDLGFEKEGEWDLNSGCFDGVIHTVPMPTLKVLHRILDLWEPFPSRHFPASTSRSMRTFRKM